MAKGSRLAGRLLEVYSIGAKLRALRMQKGLTLSRLAKETSLSTALLSKLETDTMIPTLPTLATISRMYGVGLGFFFADAVKHSLSITRNLRETGRGRTREALKQFLLNRALPSINSPALSKPELVCLKSARRISDVCLMHAKMG